MGEVDSQGFKGCFFQILTMKNISIPSWDRRGLPDWIVLVMGLIPALLVWYSLRNQDERGGREQFALHVREIVGNISSRLRQNEQILPGGAGLFDASKTVARSEWQKELNRQNSFTKIPRGPTSRPL
jgi:hypothetical protein